MKLQKIKEKTKEVLKNACDKNKRVCVSVVSAVVCFVVLFFRIVQDNRESTATARTNNRECKDLCNSATKYNREITKDLERAEQTLKTIRKKGSKD